VDRFGAPVLAIFGGADEGIPPEQVEAFRAALEREDVPHHVVTYEGAPHSFFDRTQAEHAQASAEAWKEVLGFIGRA
jgi:carboxymethylenebutenolidase